MTMEPPMAISTGSSEFDALLRGGLQMPGITEIFGPPGCGKTQLCLQLAANALTSRSIHPEGLSVVFVDTERTFRRSRFQKIFEAAEQKNGVKPSKPWDRIRVLHPDSLDEFLACIALLSDVCEELQNVGLIVIDSLAHIFRCLPIDLSLVERAKLLGNVHQGCLRLCQTRGLAVVMVNQMTMEYGASALAGTEVVPLVPALGDAWSFYPAFRIGLDFHGSASISPDRKAYLYKAPFSGRGKNHAHFTINDEGIRDLVQP